MTKSSDIPSTSHGSSKGQFSTLKTRMTPGAMLGISGNMLSEKQISDIDEIGFKSLLSIQADKVPGQLAYWLVSTFDPFACTLMDGKLEIDEVDIHNATGIPMGTVTVNEASMKDTSDHFVGIRDRWLSQFDPDKPKLLKSELLAKLVSQRDGGDDFKRNFVVYMVSTFLKGIKSANVSNRILNCLEDISRISSMNWFQFTLDNLCHSVVEWKSKPSSMFSGPIMVLLFIYLDRVIFQRRSVSRAFPTMSTWTPEAISQRVNDEMKLAKSFGKGRVVGRIDKNSMCSHSSAATISHTDTNLDKDAQHGSNPSSTCTIARTTVIALRSLDKSVVNDDAIPDPPSHLASGCDYNVPEPTFTVPGPSAGVPEPLRSVPQHPVEHIMASPPRDISGSTPFMPLPSTPTTVRRRSPRLTTDDVQPHVIVAKRKRQKLREGIDYPSFKLLPSEEDSSSQDSPPVIEIANPLPQQKGYETPGPTSFNPTRDSLAFPKRAIVPSSSFKSPFLQRILPITDDLTQEQKDVVDLTFGEIYDGGVVLFDNGLFQLTRSELRTLLSEKVSVAVINIWSQILNHLEKKRSVASHLRLYAAIIPRSFSCEDVVPYSKSMLVFFPFITPNMLLVCVNFQTSMIDVFSASQPSQILFSAHVQLVKNFIKRTMIPKSRYFLDVEHFKIQTFAVGIDALPDNFCDNGICLMRFMETYKGRRNFYTTGITNSAKGGVAGAIDRLKVLYCHSIITSEMNVMRSEVIRNARQLGSVDGSLPPDDALLCKDMLLQRVMQRVRNVQKFDYDVAVDTVWMHVTYRGI
ncbi:hypothetical protein RND81_01G024000 [Saponaria officinalis]|uniref:Uncharacterized protein n=1 Tax=Saponaria officinalis TaxID=3572 RepID=A0AAW1NB38_SAPOF